MIDAKSTCYVLPNQPLCNRHFSKKPLNGRNAANLTKIGKSLLEQRLKACQQFQTNGSQDCCTMALVFTAIK